MWSSKNVISRLYGDYRHLSNARLFKNALYVFIIFKCTNWVINFDLLFGENAMSLLHAQSIPFYREPAFILLKPEASIVSALSIVCAALISMIQVVSRRSFILADLILYGLVININNKTYTHLTAGDPLLVNLLFLSVFLRKSNTGTNEETPWLSILLHNTSYAALVLQICIVYAYSALAKWADADWQHGTAIDSVNRAIHYSRPLIATYADNISIIAMVLNYLILAYQTLFPVLVFLKPIKRYFLILGMCMHVYIAFVMGIFSFGIIMVITYFLFLDMPGSPAKRSE